MLPIKATATALQIRPPADKLIHVQPHQRKFDKQGLWNEFFSHSLISFFKYLWCVLAQCKTWVHGSSVPPPVIQIPYGAQLCISLIFLLMFKVPDLKLLRFSLFHQTYSVIVQSFCKPFFHIVGTPTRR